MTTPLDIEALARLHYGEPEHPERNGAAPPETLITSWQRFDELAAGGMAYRIAGLLPAEGLGFTASGPKRGKTWLALAKAISVATGREYLERFEVVERCPVVYVALEGSPGGVRARIGALARGMGIDPDSPELRDWLHLVYKPRGINLSDPAWAERLIADAERVEARLVVVDVLRRAASVRESADGVGDFAKLVRNLEPLIDGERFLELLHHFRKEGSADENAATGERMSGTGSLHGHYDAAMFITSGTDLSMAVEVDGRDFRPPQPFRVEIKGEATGPWGYVYEDAARIVAVDAPARKVAKASVEEIRAFIMAAGGEAAPGAICGRFGIDEKTLRRRRSELDKAGVRYLEDGKRSRYMARGSGGAQ
ncbi:AAA family ATPase [Miltoncostaea marina]|uniref:AAA family ATPase n=1 Tax=Miltoncostaea marina TaxID=2843215 RepID=UPI001C3E6D5B|nr:AAA family ATPase [Miltoncostaea marina]